MWTFIHKFASPQTCYRWLSLLQPWTMLFCLFAFSIGLIDGLIIAPADYQQGDAYRMMYLHVPAAIMSLLVYLVMTVGALFFFIWKIKVADIIAKTSAPIGAVFTLLTLITGSIWGKPTWGTWWIWDARLTSELILLFIYLGVIAIRSAIPDSQLGARASSLIAMVGVVNIPIIHYSVDWWNTLHQGASLSFFEKPTIAPSMLYPLSAMILGFLFYYMWLLIMKVRRELLYREQKTAWVKQFIIKR